MEKAVAKNVEDILLFKKGYTKVRREGGVTREITGGARCTVSNQAESKKLTQTQSQTQSQTAIASLTALQNSSNKLIPPPPPPSLPPTPHQTTPNESPPYYLRNGLTAVPSVPIKPRASRGYIGSRYKTDRTRTSIRERTRGELCWLMKWD